MNGLPEKNSPYLIYIMAIILAFSALSCRVEPLFDVDTEDRDAVRRRGYEMINQGRYNDAMKVFEFAVEKFPNDASLYNGYGLAAERAERISLAVHKFRQACWIEPYNETYRNHFVRVYEQQRRRQTGDHGITDYATGSAQLGYLDRVRNTVTGVDQQMFQRAVELFKSRHRRLPENLQELVNDGIIGPNELTDPFGRPYWSYLDNNTFVVQSSGEDMVMFTDYDRIIRIQ